MLLTARNPRSWILVPFALGFLASIDARLAQDARRIEVPLLADGWIEVIGIEGKGAVLRIGERRVLAAGADSLGLVPGFEVRGMARIDPLHGLEEPAGFRAERWGRARSLDGRARFLGPIESTRPAPGVRAAIRRAGGYVRANARARLERRDEPEGELLVALLIGDRSGLTPADREAFRRAGLAHVLALSGMHVSLLAMGLGSLLGTLRFDARLSFVLLGTFLIWFTDMTGLLAPVVRSCATAILAGFGMLLGRRTLPLHALGLVAAAMLLASPVLLEDLGFRLSFLATGVLLLGAAAPSSRRPRGARPSRVAHALRNLGAGLRISTAIVLATAPDLAQSVGRWSALAPITNLASAIPSFGALGWGAIAGLAPLPEAIVHLLARAARLCAWALLEVCRRSAEIPGADLATVPLPLSGGIALLALGGLLARAQAPGARTSRAVVLLVTLAALHFARSHGRERITFLDVGQGDAVLIERGRHTALIDAGPPEDDAIRAVTGRSAVGDACRRRGVARADAAILSHGHLDHAGSFDEILRARAVLSLLLPPRHGSEAAPELVRTLEALADSCGIARGPAPSPDRPRRLLEGALVVSSAWPGEPPPGTEENDLSLVARWSTRSCAALLTGDLEEEGERALLSSESTLLEPVWLMKAGHHGGRTSTGSALLERARPRVIVFSCGANNTHGHPHAATLQRCADAGAVVLRTDRDGSIAITSTTRGVRVRWERFDRGR